MRSTSQRSTGASYGGKGGVGDAGGISADPYGLPATPVDPGSGGCQTDKGGAGGGVVRIEVTDAATINGTISANGQNYLALFGGGGSGGSIYITCSTLAGSNTGLLSVDGGNGNNWAGAGGGGRIAVIYSQASPWPGIRMSASPGTGRTVIPYGAGQGSVYLPDTAALSPVIADNQFNDVDLSISGLTSWAVSSLTVSNSSFRFNEINFMLTVTNDLTIYAGSLGVVSVDCGRDINLANGGNLYVYSGPTNDPGNDYGALVDVTRDINIDGSSWIHPISHSTNGGSPLFRMRNLTVAEGGGFDATVGGYKWTFGFGKGDIGPRTRGGGYGGRGGVGQFGGTGGLTYGYTNAPLGPGSGGSLPNYGGFGGGLVRIEASGDVVLDGTIKADGGRNPASYGGGGSGGGIFVSCSTFAGGSNALLQAKGGIGQSNTSGGGGGGRIAVWYGVPSDKFTKILADPDNPDAARGIITTNSIAEFTGTLSVTGGMGWSSLAGEVGTFVFLTTETPKGTVFMFR